MSGTHGVAVMPDLSRWSYSTQGHAPLPTLKAQLRELYKRIHPDTFHDHPEARDANEHSFKALQVVIEIPQQCRQLSACLFEM